MYEDDVKLFETVLSTKADNLLKSEDLAIVYIGRGTCPFCRKFANKLSGLTNKIDATINYVDSDNFSDNELSSFREKYNIITVPGFIVSKNKEIQVRCDSQTPEDEILDMVR